MRGAVPPPVKRRTSAIRIKNPKRRFPCQVAMPIIVTPRIILPQYHDEVFGLCANSGPSHENSFSIWI
jgi:hypothetical protein